MTGIKTYLLSVAAASLLTSFISVVIPEGMIKKVASFTGSLVLILAILSPIVKLDAATLVKAIGDLQVDTEALQSDVEGKNRKLLAELISERCEEYILDKTAAMGLDLEIVISIREGTDMPVPVAASIQGACSEDEQEVISKILEQDLGILQENQEWVVP